MNDWKRRIRCARGIATIVMIVAGCSTINSREISVDIEAVDTDGDSIVTFAEWKEYYNGRETLFREADRNADGALDVQEYQLMIRIELRRRLRDRVDKVEVEIGTSPSRS